MPLRIATTLCCCVLLTAAEARAGSEFWEEMANPGITEYRRLVDEGRGLVAVGDFTRAVELLERAIRLMPDEIEARAWRAYAFTRLGRHAEAAEAFDAVRRAEPDLLGDDLLALAAAESLAEVGRFADAAELYGHMLERGVDPRHGVSVLVSMGDMLVAGGRDGLDEAIELFQEAVRDAPNFAGGHWRLAAALYRAGRDDEGRAELTAALRLDPQWQTFNEVGFRLYPTFDVHLFRALGWEHLNNTEQALREWRAFLGAGGADGPWADLARRHLEACERRRAGARRR